MVIFMSMLASVFAKEELRNMNMIRQYTKELEQLPKGSIRAKKVKGNVYYYLNFRDGEKVVSKYIGKDEQKINDLRKQIERRIQIEKILKELKAERKEIVKMEGRL